MMAQGNFLCLCLQLRPLGIGEHVAVVEHIAHALAFQGPGHIWHRRGGRCRRLRVRFRLAGRTIHVDILRHGIHHGIGGLNQCRSAHGHVFPVPCPLRHVRCHRIIYGIRQILRAAPGLAQKGINAPIVFCQCIGSVRLRPHQQRQGNAVPVLAPTIAAVFIDVFRNVHDVGIRRHILIGKYVNPQVHLQFFRKLRQDMLAHVIQLHGAKGIGLVINHTVFRHRHGRNTQCQRQQERHQQSCEFLVHVRPSLSQHQH